MTAWPAWPPGINSPPGPREASKRDPGGNVSAAVPGNGPMTPGQTAQ